MNPGDFGPPRTSVVGGCQGTVLTGQAGARPARVTSPRGAHLLLQGLAYDYDTFVLWLTKVRARLVEDDATLSQDDDFQQHLRWASQREFLYSDSSGTSPLDGSEVREWLNTPDHGGLAALWVVPVDVHT